MAWLLGMIWMFPKMVGFSNNHGVFLIKMIILGCEMGVPPFTETPIYLVYLCCSCSPVVAATCTIQKSKHGNANGACSMGLGVVNAGISSCHLSFIMSILIYRTSRAYKTSMQDILLPHNYHDHYLYYHYPCIGHLRFLQPFSFGLGLGLEKEKRAPKAAKAKARKRKTRRRKEKAKGKAKVKTKEARKERPDLDSI